MAVAGCLFGWDTRVGSGSWALLDYGVNTTIFQPLVRYLLLVTTIKEPWKRIPYLAQTRTVCER